MTPTVAIVGSGPAGCYMAQFLRKEMPDAEITIFERLPVPYGLIRYGIAPDHQGTKAVTRQFERMFEREGIEFAGNLEVGRDVSLQDLREAFGITVLANGMAVDRRLGVPGDDHPQVYGAGAIIRAANAHPDNDLQHVEFGRHVVVIGNGNVAIDVVRMLIKSEADFIDSDIDDDALAAMQRVPLDKIDVLGRSSASVAKFDTAAIRELIDVEGVTFAVEDTLEAGDDDAPEAVKKLEALRALVTKQDAGSARVTVTFRFGWVPRSIKGGATLLAEFSRQGSGQEDLTIGADSIVTAIGFVSPADCEFARLKIDPAETDLALGRLGPGLYCTGWFRRGPHGTIPENRNDARMVAGTIVADLASGRIQLGGSGLDGLPSSAVEKRVSYQGWKAVDAHELQVAGAGRRRRKLRSLKHLLEVAAGKLSTTPERERSR